MSTKSFQKNAGGNKTDALEGKPPAKGRFLFRKVAPIVATGLLAAGCGGPQYPQVCPKNIGGVYSLDGNCIPPQEPQWKADASKEEPKPDETQCKTNTALDCNARGMQILLEFKKTTLSKGVSVLKDLILSSRESYLFLENGKIEIHKAGGFTLGYKANYENGVLLFQLSEAAPSSPGYKVKTKVDAKVGDSEDDSMTPMQRATVPHTDVEQVITPAGQVQPEVHVNCKVSASGKKEMHILEFNPEGNPMMGKAIAVYDREKFYITLLTPYRQEWDARWFDIAKIWGPDKEFLVATWSDGQNAAVFLIPNNFGPSDKVLALPLIKNENGKYVVLENLFSFKFDGPTFDSVESQ